MSRVTSTKVKERIATWNEYNPDIPMGVTFSLGYCGIGHLDEHGTLDIVASGETPREAWEKFSCWKAGYGYCERKMRKIIRR